MKIPKQILSSSGFSIVEGVMAAAMLSAMGIMVGRFMLTQTQNTVMINNTNRAKVLADMVLEQYSSYASEATLSVHDKQKVSPMQFFGTADNLGFDSYLITTQANCAASSLNCRVDATITWTQGGLGSSQASKTFSRNYMFHHRQNAGATVDVWVKIPCRQADDDATIQTCSGLGGFEVRAGNSAVPGFHNSQGTSEVIGYTTADGHARLRNVVPGSGQTVKVRKPGSPFYASGAAFSPGYYVLSGGLPVSTEVKNLDITQTGTNQIVFTEFLPLGTVKGTLTNESSTTQNRMMVVLDGYASTGFGIQKNARWNVYTRTDPITGVAGSYVFHNVAPGPVTLWAAGDPGSHPSVPYGDPRFRWGYSNHKPYNNITLAAPADATHPTVLPQDVSIKRMGWLQVKTFKDDGKAAIGAHVNTRLPATLFRHSIPFDFDTSSGGPIGLFNVIDIDGTTMSFSGATGAVSPTKMWHFENLGMIGSTALENQVMITMAPTVDFEFCVKDLDGNPIGPGTNNPVDSNWQIALTHQKGRIGWSMQPPPSSGCLRFPYLPLYSPLLPDPKHTEIWLYNGALQFTGTFQGKVVDALTGDAVPNIGLYSGLTSNPYYSDSNGNFVMANLQNPYDYNVVVDFIPGNDFLAGPSAKDVLVPNTDTNRWNPNTVTIDRTLSQASISVSAPGYALLHSNQFNGGGISITYRNAVPVTGIVIPVDLVSYYVNGIVTDPSGAPLGGVKVCDAQWQTAFDWPLNAAPPVPSKPLQNCTVTDSAGSYTIDASIVGRKKDTNGTIYPGWVAIYVPPNQTLQNGYSYSGARSNAIGIPNSSPDPTKGRNQDIMLTPIPGSI